MAKVIKFPTKYSPKTKINVRNGVPPQNAEEVAQATFKAHVEHSEIIVGDCIRYILSRAAHDGINFQSQGIFGTRDVGLIAESIRSAIFRVYEIKHDLQQIANEQQKQAERKMKNKKEIEQLNPIMDSTPDDDGPMVE